MANMNPRMQLMRALAMRQGGRMPRRASMLQAFHSLAMGKNGIRGGSFQPLIHPVMQQQAPIPRDGMQFLPQMTQAQMDAKAGNPIPRDGMQFLPGLNGTGRGHQPDINDWYEQNVPGMPKNIHGYAGIGQIVRDLAQGGFNQHQYERMLAGRGPGGRGGTYGSLTPQGRELLASLLTSTTGEDGMTSYNLAEGLTPRMLRPGLRGMGLLKRRARRERRQIRTALTNFNGSIPPIGIQPDLPPIEIQPYFPPRNLTY